MIAAITQPLQTATPSSEIASQMPKMIVPSEPTATATVGDREEAAGRDHLLGKIGAPDHDDPDPEHDHGRDERERAQQVESEQPVVQLHGATISNRQDDFERSRSRSASTGDSLLP